MRELLEAEADLSDRQVMLLAAPQYNRGLPADLVGMQGPESHNQDKVSMGTIAARDAARSCTLSERVVAIHDWATTAVV